MSEEWQNLVIETGVDTLLNYLAERQQAPVSQISKDIGVSEKRIKEWAGALEDEKFIHKTYSARKGMILHYTESNKESVDDKLKSIKKEVDQRTEEVNQEMKKKSTEIQEAKKALKKMSEQLEENREEEEEIKSNLEDLENLENELEEKLKKQKEKKEKVHSETVQLLSRIDNALNRIDQAEEKASSFEEKEYEIRKKIKAFRKLEKHSSKVEDLEEELEQMEKMSEKSDEIVESFKDKIRQLFESENGSEYEDLLDRPVKEIREKIPDEDEKVYREILQKETQWKDRKSLKKFLKKKIEND